MCIQNLPKITSFTPRRAHFPPRSRRALHDPLHFASLLIFIANKMRISYADNILLSSSAPHFVAPSPVPLPLPHPFSGELRWIPPKRKDDEERSRRSSYYSALLSRVRHLTYHYLMPYHISLSLFKRADHSSQQKATFYNVTS